MDLGFKGKTAMVAAAGRGLGFGVARVLAFEGARVSIASRRSQSITRAAQTISSETGAQVRGYVFDASDGASIERWTGDTVARFGTVDCLLVNAGGPPAGNFDDFDDQHWESAFRLTLLSSVRLIRAVLPHMRAQKKGSILVVTSTAVREPIENLLLSNVMRAGVAGLVKTLSRELAPDNIRINNLVPGRFDTDRVRELDDEISAKKGISPQEQKSSMQQLIPLGRYGTTEEFGNAAAFLLSDSAGYVTGESFFIDGGLTKGI